MGGSGTPNLGDFTLLVVDDVDDNRDLLSRRLRRVGFNVVVAANGPDALAMLGANRIDLVILDVMMPGMSGIDVLKAVRANPALAGVAVIMVTARAESEQVVEALDAGANDYVTKPIDFPVLQARVQVALRSRIQTAGKSERRIGEGAMIASRYLLDTKIGEGGFGAVYRAMHTELQRTVAVKVLHPSHTSGNLLGRFRLEGVHACRVQHPNALNVLDSGVTDDGIAFLAMELLDGHSLEHEMARGPTPFVRCAEILAPVCDALATAHAAGIVHRDIKPANIFLHRGMTGEVPKVLDFGIAKFIGESATDQQMTLDGSLVGTPAYMAPERFTNQPYDGKSDVYAVGVLLNQMICGALPFPQPTTARTSIEPMALMMMHTVEAPVPLRQRDPSVPPALEALVLRTLAKDPNERPTASELAVLLGEAVAGVPPDAVAKFATPLLGIGSSKPGEAVKLATEPTRPLRGSQPPPSDHGTE
ncbi:MAG: response regulator [Kofleriaceae bacterium]